MQKTGWHEMPYTDGGSIVSAVKVTGELSGAIERAQAVLKHAQEARNIAEQARTRLIGSMPVAGVGCADTPQPSPTFSDELHGLLTRLNDAVEGIRTHVTAINDAL